MKNKFLIISFFLLVNTFATNDLFACYCDGGWTFCLATFSIENDLIVSGEITYVDSTKLLLKIVDTFKGDAGKDTITIWAGTDYECPPTWFSLSTIELGKKGDSIIIILPKIDSTNVENIWDVIGDYRRPYDLCITTFLQLKRDSVFGEIKDRYPRPNSTTWRLSYEHFKSIWNNGEIDCNDLVGLDDIGNTKVDICLDNNNLIIENYENLDLSINIFDQTGRRLNTIKSITDQKIIIDQVIKEHSFIIVQILEKNRLIINEKIRTKN